MPTSAGNSRPCAPRRLLARSVGPAFQSRGPVFQVHSVYRAAIYLKGQGSAMLVCLVSGDYEPPPNGMALAETIDLRSLELLRGAAASLRDGVLSFDVVGGSRVEVQFAGAKREEACHAGPPARLGPSFMMSALRLESQVRKAQGMLSLDLIGCGEGQSGMQERLLDGARSLGRAASERDSEAGALSARRLVGLGPGLTPSGDDFLCGFLAGLRASGQEGASELRFILAVCAAVEGSLVGTSDTSASFLRCAVLGFAQPAILSLASALANDSPLEAIDSLERIFRQGHSSGADTATGFLYGLSLWAQGYGPFSDHDSAISKEAVC